MTVLDCGIGSYKVVSVATPYELERRLEALGLTEGTRLDILGKKRNGASVIKVRGTRFAIGAEIAAGITIEEERG